MKRDVDPALEVEKLLVYAENRGLLQGEDKIVVRNSLLDLLNLTEPHPDRTGLDLAGEQELTEILANLLTYALTAGLIPDDTVTSRDLFDTRITGALMPRQSEVSRHFWQLAGEDSIQAATDWFYQLAWDSNYVRADRIARNQSWRSQTDSGELEITINLSKPEKDPDEIARAKEAEAADYPACVLCPDNAGYAGRLDHPARQNLRLVPVTLGGERWYLQYSPYVYYSEHCIVLAREHREMSVDRTSFVRLLEFLDVFPHYFIGSNADLPLVGGSILNHDHFQGGRYSFAMEKAGARAEFAHPDHPELDVEIVDWPLSTVRLRAGAKEPLLELADEILRSWRRYSLPELDVLASTVSEGEKVQHNAVTPIARRKDGKYELDLVLRNNRKSEEHPDGIFHPHRDLHHVKKENVGLIEVMGLAILPGRLKRELAELAEYLSGGKTYAPDDLTPALEPHRAWLEELLAEYGSELSAEEAAEVLQRETAEKFNRVLSDAGVFKDDTAGNQAFQEFLNEIGLVLQTNVTS